MYSNKKMLWIIIILIFGLALFVAIKTISLSDHTSAPRGVLVERIDCYGC